MKSLGKHKILLFLRKFFAKPLSIEEQWLLRCRPILEKAEKEQTDRLTTQIAKLFQAELDSTKEEINRLKQKISEMSQKNKTSQEAQYD